MAGVSTYLNFDGTCEEAFEFYKAAFGGEFDGPLMRMGELPPPGDAPPLPDELAARVLHVALPIVGGHQLMGSDTMPGMTPPIVRGNAMHIHVRLDDEETMRDLFATLAEGGEVSAEPSPMFWGDLYGTFFDRFGIQWMMTAPLTEGIGLA